MDVVNKVTTRKSEFYILGREVTRDCNRERHVKVEKGRCGFEYEGKNIKCF